MFLFSTLEVINHKSLGNYEGRKSCQVDETAVLKHFNWPEQKADALREAAFEYCDFKKLESEALAFRDDARQPCALALKKMQALLEKYDCIFVSLSHVSTHVLQF